MQRKIPAQFEQASVNKELATNSDYTNGFCPVCKTSMVLSSMDVGNELVPVYVCLNHNVVLPVSE